MITTTLWAPLEIAINRYLRLDPDCLPQLRKLDGKIVAVEFKGLPLKVYLRIADDRVYVLGEFEGTPDTCLRGTPLAMVKLGMSETSAKTLFQGDVEIEGDLETGRQFKTFLDTIDIDWEEQLSRLVGDVAAHQVGNLLRGSLVWGKQVADTLSQDAAEYLQEETQELPRPDEVDAFLAEVDSLRSDVDRLAARVNRIQTKITPSQEQDVSHGSMGKGK